MVTELVRVSPLAELYQATQLADGAPVSVHVLHPGLVASEPIAQTIAKACEHARAIDHKNVLRTIEVLREGDVFAVVTELIDGNPVIELLERKRELGKSGFAPRGAGNIMAGVCNAISAGSTIVPHGSLASHNVYVSSAGRVKVAGFGMGLAIVAAVRAGATHAEVAPEVAKAGRGSIAGDLYSAGRLLYELLVGSPLVKGGKRPSQIEGVPAVVDEIIARCNGPADKRPQSADVLKKAIADALSGAGKPAAAAKPKGSGRPSLAQAIAKPAASNTGIPIQSSTALPTTSSSNAADPLSDTEERWLICKGKLDFGPFSMAAVAEMIRKSEILPGHVLVDKDTGARAAIEDNPLLVPLVDAAKQARDDQRRAQAEISHAQQEKRRGTALYAFIGMGVLVLGLGTYFIISKLSSGGGKDKSKVVIAGAEVDLDQSYEKDPAKRKKRRKWRRNRRRSSGGGGGEDTATNLSFSGENDESGGERLSGGQVNQAIQANSGGLIRCKQKYGSVSIKFGIGGNGRVRWVRVNGKRSGGAYSCINGALRRIQFPTFDGVQTRASLTL